MFVKEARMPTRSAMRNTLIAAVVFPVTCVVASAQTPDHMKFYSIRDSLSLKGHVDLSSVQAGLEPGCKVSKAFLFCVPAQSTVVDAQSRGESIQPTALGGPNPGDRICYKIKCSGALPPAHQVTDTFGTRSIQPIKSYTLCTPAVEGGPPSSPSPPPPMCEDPTGSANVILNCNTGGGYEVTSKLGPPPQSGAPVLRVIGIYQPWPTSEPTVHVKRAERTVLVLSSYDPVHWTITVEPGATLERVLLFGYYAQTVTVPAGVPVEDHSNDVDSPTGHEWPSDDTAALLARAEQLTGLCLTSFHGCYEANRFSIPAGDVGSPGAAFIE